MLRPVGVVLLLVAACLRTALAGESAAISVLDDRGMDVALPAPARRVVAISPHLAELAFDAGAGDLLVAVVRGSDYPPAAAGLPVVGDASGLDFERILALRPDLVLAWGGGNRAPDIERLERAGARVFVAAPRRLDDVARHLRAIGRLAGRAERAQAAARAFERRLAALRVRYAAREPVRVFVEVWHRPLFTLGPRHIVSDVLATCGARNAIVDLPGDAAAVSPETLYALDPDAIVSALGETRDQTVQAWRSFGRLRAVRTGALIALPPDLILRATWRLLDGTQALCSALEKVRTGLRS
ncbi:MAG TPA: helical backbone metal receptor [Burkholderiales bacterium]|nr:helical backbone metal receptor [Burkholderiales bacterium]